MSYRTVTLLFCFLLLVCGCASTGQQSSVLESNSRQPTPGMTSRQFAELDSLMAEQARPIAVLLHASWCRFCRNMEQTTLRNEEVIQLVNKDYYFIFFDGEQQDDVTFRGHTFRYQPRGRNTGTHELATALGTIDGHLTYPTLVLLDEQYNIIFQHNSFLSSEEMIGVLRRALERD